MDSITALAKNVSKHSKSRNANRDRRREPRARTAAIARLTQQDRGEVECVLENLSVSGACVYLNTELEPGTLGSLYVSNIVRDVIVEYCNPCERGFKIGLQFTRGRWPEQVIGPFHWIRNA
jgi:hypothetical protein